MTTSAWVMLILTWTVIVFFSARFLLAVLRKPGSASGEAASASKSEGEPE